jgi:hypothetical protein
MKEALRWKNFFYAKTQRQNDTIGQNDRKFAAMMVASFATTADDDEGNNGDTGTKKKRKKTTTAGIGTFGFAASTVVFATFCLAGVGTVSGEWRMPTTQKSSGTDNSKDEDNGCSTARVQVIGGKLMKDDYGNEKKQDKTKKKNQTFTGVVPGGEGNKDEG